MAVGDFKDFIDDCMNDTGVEASIPEFMQAFCSRCLNPDCKRSKINDLQWQQRMDRQLKALNSPEFADPSDPNFQPHANQNFQSFDKQQVKASSWESFSEADPEHFQKDKPPEKDPIIHRADPPSESRNSRKIDDSVNRLATAKGKEVPNKEDDPDVEEPSEAEEVETVVAEEAPEPDPEPRDRERESEKRPRKVAKPKRNQYNTDVPDGGILLKPQEEMLKPSQRESEPARDKWAVPDDDDGPLVVRASDGKKVDKDRSGKYKGRSKSEEKD